MHLQPCSCLGTAGVPVQIYHSIIERIIEIWAVSASVCPACHHACPLPGGQVSPFLLPKARLEEVTPRRGVHANGAPQNLPQPSHYPRGLDPAPASGIFCLCPHPASLTVFAAQVRANLRGIACLTAILPIRAKDLL